MIKTVSSLAALAALVGAVSAQGFGGGMGRMMGGSSSMASLMLLNRPDVQEELKLTDAQKARLDTLKSAAMTQIQSTMMTLRNADPADRQTQMQTMFDGLGKQGMQILSEDQQKRLKELAIQSSGTLVILQPDVSKVIVLSAAQKARIDELQRKQNEANQNLIEQRQNGDIDQDDLMARLQKNRKTLEDLVAKALTDAQRAKLKELGGKPFEFKEPKPGAPGSSGRPGG